MEYGYSLLDHEDQDYSPENSEDYSPSSALFNDAKNTSTSSPKRSRRSKQKRVVSVPITEIEGYRHKGETNAPPSDSWAWRKYGQKPIKGSPYPRQGGGVPVHDASLPVPSLTRCQPSKRIQIDSILTTMYGFSL
ncbi:WRKY10 [Artemisia annua]|uniref:WRKY10 n=1 Tax=Artemisia annua TaxID=35608 RepID=A0A2U1NNX5_ARTAN|nr:WRKY10 [Artemisia annua]